MIEPPELLENTPVGGVEQLNIDVLLQLAEFIMHKDAYSTKGIESLSFIIIINVLQALLWRKNEGSTLRYTKAAVKLFSQGKASRLQNIHVNMHKKKAIVSILRYLYYFMSVPLYAIIYYYITNIFVSGAFKTKNN